jgi:HEPN domain-containing protein
MITLDEYIRQWIIKAQHDLAIAQHERAVKGTEIITDGICFHCQQAVEKFLKAFLVYNGVDFPKTHSLEEVRDLCAEKDPAFSSLQFETLSKFGVQYRYPDDFYIPSLEETDRFISIAANVREFVLLRLPQHFHS